MTYRDDLDAAHARTEALEPEVRKRNADLETVQVHADALAQEVAEVRRQNAVLEARLAPPAPVARSIPEPTVHEPARRRVPVRLIATVLMIAGVALCTQVTIGDGINGWIGVALIVS